MDNVGPDRQLLIRLYIIRNSITIGIHLPVQAFEKHTSPTYNRNIPMIKRTKKLEEIMDK